MNGYQIQFLGQIDVKELNATSPHQMTLVRATPEATLVSICTDQSGLIGLLRHLHGRGLVLQSIQSAHENIRKEKNR